jgi:glycosyltransferase involved in cell wall biosynthesis
LPALDTGGVERTTIDIAKALVAEGHQALVASSGGRLASELLNVGAHHFSMPLDRKNPFQIFANAQKLSDFIEAHDVDIVHARSRAPAISALIAAKNTKRPFVTTYHGIYNQTNWFKAQYNSVMARGDAVIANSRYTASIIKKRHGTPDEKLHVVYRGTHLAAFSREAVSADRIVSLKKRWNLPQDAKIMLQVGRLTAWKGQPVAIKALSELKDKHPDLVLVLAGDQQGRETYRQFLLDLANTLGVADKVFLVGHLSDVAAGLALADLALVCSVEPEAFGRAAVEAQAMGVPVIVSDLGAVPETVLAPPDVDEDKRTGWRVVAGDTHALSQAITHVLTVSPTEQAKLAARARNHVEKQFSLEVMQKETLKIYTMLASQP